MAPRLKKVTLEQDTESSRRRREQNIEANRRNRSGGRSVTFINEQGEQETRRGDRNEIDAARARLKAGQAVTPERQPGLDILRTQAAARQQGEFEVLTQKAKQEALIDQFGGQPPEQTMEEQPISDTQQFPQRAELEPVEAGGLAEFGAATISPLFQPLVQGSLTTVGQLIKDQLGIDPIESPEIEALDQRELVREAVAKKVYEKGLNRNEKLGALIEAVPFAGSLLSRYVGEFINTPEGSISVMRREIMGVREEAITLGEIATSSPRLSAATLTELETMEERLFELEAKIGLMVNYSSNLKAQPEEIDLIEQELARAKKKIFSAKEKASLGAAGLDVGGLTDNQLYLLANEGKL